MRIDILKKRKHHLIWRIKLNSEELFTAQQQDCYGMSDKIQELRREDSFLAEWLGDVQYEIDNINKTVNPVVSSHGYMVQYQDVKRGSKK